MYDINLLRFNLNMSSSTAVGSLCPLFYCSSVCVPLWKYRTLKAFISTDIHLWNSLYICLFSEEAKTHGYRQTVLQFDSGNDSFTSSRSESPSRHTHRHMHLLNLKIK